MQPEILYNRQHTVAAALLAMSQFERDLCIGMMVLEVSNFRNVSVSTVRRWWHRFQEIGTVVFKKRPRKISKRADRNLIRLTKRKKFAAALVILRQ